MVDTYPYKTIPRDATNCINPSTADTSSAGALNGPLNVELSVSVSSNSQIQNLKQYHDDYTIPILINNYFAGDTITITVTYKWNNNVAQANIPSDYSISVYSKQKLQVKKSGTGN